MEDLSKKKCVPCDGGIPSFNLGEIHKYLKKVDGWDVKKDENENFYLIKEFKFGTDILKIPLIFSFFLNILRTLKPSS